MRVLVTGHEGYIGVVLVSLLREAGHDVVGFDSCLFKDCTFGSDPLPVPLIRKDVRDAATSDLEGFDAVLHLAGISNDPLGDLNPECTLEINHRASVRLARLDCLEQSLLLFPVGHISPADAQRVKDTWDKLVKPQF